MGPKLRQAQEALRHAIASTSVKAWGRPKPQAPYEQVPGEQFRILGLPVAVDVYGEMVSLRPEKPYDGPTWHSLEFKPQEIKHAFPPLPPLSATEWMLNEAKTMKALGRIGKREDMVKRCREATKCTDRQAKAAYGRLPLDLRLARGKPRTASA
jgi:hypothetical protein